MDAMLWHEEALAETEPSRIGSPAPGSPAEKAAVARFTSFFGSLTEETVRARVREVYAAGVRFNDTLKPVRGVDALERYLLETARNIESCRVEIEEASSTPQGVYVRWKMHVSLKKLRRGETLGSYGVTQLRFDRDGKVAYHQDYWDSGANLFEHVPLLGAAIRALKRRL
jgi:hypothetical protein